MFVLLMFKRIPFPHNPAPLSALSVLPLWTALDVLRLSQMNASKGCDLTECYSRGLDGKVLISLFCSCASKAKQTSGKSKVVLYALLLISDPSGQNYIKVGYYAASPSNSSTYNTVSLQERLYPVSHSRSSFQDVLHEQWGSSGIHQNVGKTPSL